MNNIENNSKEKQNMNPIVKYLIIALTAVGITGVAVFGVYRNNQIKEAATQQEVIVDNDATDLSLLNDKSGQETVDFESLCRGWYDTHQSEIKDDTTWDEWYAQGKVFWQDTNKSEEDTLSGLLAYFAPDTLTAEEVTEPESIEVTVDEDVKAIVDAEVHGNDEATAEESVETVEVESTEATAEASTTEVSTDTVKQDKHDYEIEYKDTPETMYAVKGVNVRKGPATDYDKVKVLKVNEKIEAIGIVSEVDDEETYWVVFKDADGNQLFVSGAYVDTKPITTSNSSNSSSNSGTTQQPAKTEEKNNGSTSSGGQQSSGNSSAWDKLLTPKNHDYSTSGSAQCADCGSQGINWN